MYFTKAPKKNDYFEFRDAAKNQRDGIYRARILST